MPVLVHELFILYNLTSQKRYVTELKWIWPVIVSGDSPEIISSPAYLCEKTVPSYSTGNLLPLIRWPWSRPWSHHSSAGRIRMCYRLTTKNKNRHDIRLTKTLLQLNVQVLRSVATNSYVSPGQHFVFLNVQPPPWCLYLLQNLFKQFLNG